MIFLSSTFFFFLLLPLHDDRSTTFPVGTAGKLLPKPKNRPPAAAVMGIAE